jgi:hypothetical protein
MRGASCTSRFAKTGRADRFHRRRRRVTLQQIQNRWVVQVRAEDPLQRGVDLGEETADAVARGGDLADDIVVEAAKHRELSNLLIGQLQRPQSVREAPCGLGDDRRVAGVGLRFARVQVRDTAHRQARQVAHEHAFRLGDGNREGADGRGLIDDEEDLAVLLQLPDQVA